MRVEQSYTELFVIRLTWGQNDIFRFFEFGQRLFYILGCVNLLSVEEQQNFLRVVFMPMLQCFITIMHHKL